jgi:hypothetical protein
MHATIFEDLSRFVQPGRVHRQTYTDPAIFELTRIFGVAWIYVGHESQVTAGWLFRRREDDFRFPTSTAIFGTREAGLELALTSLAAWFFYCIEPLRNKDAMNARQCAAIRRSPARRRPDDADRRLNPDERQQKIPLQ